MAEDAVERNKRIEIAGKLMARKFHGFNVSTVYTLKP
jgi:hypothetical protein